MKLYGLDMVMEPYRATTLTVDGGEIEDEASSTLRSDR